MQFHRPVLGFLSGILILGAPLAAQGVPITQIATGTVVAVSGSYTGRFVLGETVVGNYTYDTDEANASFAQTSPYKCDPGQRLDGRAAGSGLLLVGPHR